MHFGDGWVTVTVGQGVYGKGRMRVDGIGSLTGGGARV
jgi:hypothetical protein